MKKTRTIGTRKKLMNLLYLPALALFAVFTIYPLLSGFQLSFMKWNGYSADKVFVGISNYLAMFEDVYFGRVMLNTLLFAFACTIIQQVFGMGLAIVLDQKFRGCNAARTIIYMPVLVSPIIMGSIYYMLLQYNGGAFNDIVMLLGGEKIAWLSNEYLALFWIVIINSVQFMGLSMILYLTGLQNISTMYYEAAKTDGASTWQTFINVTFPLLSPAVVTSVTLNLIGGLKLYDIIKVLTNGGPGYSTNSVSTYISLMYFNSEKAGYASALGVLLFVMILLVSIGLNTAFAKWEGRLYG